MSFVTCPLLHKTMFGLVNEHENVVCAKKSFIEKGYKSFLVKNKTREARISFIFDFFSILKILMYL